MSQLPPPPSPTSSNSSPLQHVYEKAHQKVITISDIMMLLSSSSNHHDSDQYNNTAQLSLPASPAAAAAELFYYYHRGEFKSFKYNHQNFTILTTQYSHYYQCLLFLVKQINGHKQLVYYLNVQEDDNFIDVFGRDIKERSEVMKRMMGQEFVFEEEIEEESLSFSSECKLLPLPLRRGEFVVEIDKSGMLMKTNLNSIWEITSSVIDFNGNSVRHIIYGNGDHNMIHEISDFNDEVIHFENSGHSTFLTKKGKVYGFGYNTYCQLNLSGEGDTLIEHLKDLSFEHGKVKKVIPGRYKTHFITENGKIYAAGENNNFLIGCSEGNTKEQVYDIIVQNSGEFHSYGAKECDLLDGYEIVNVCPVGFGDACGFITRDNQLVICGKYSNGDEPEVISVAQPYNELGSDERVDQFHTLHYRYLLVISNKRKLHIIGRPKYQDFSDIANVARRQKREKEQEEEHYFIELIKTQLETLLSMDERIFGKLRIYTNEDDRGFAFSFDLSLDLYRFFKLLKRALTIHSNNKKQETLSDILIVTQ